MTNSSHTLAVRIPVGPCGETLPTTTVSLHVIGPVLMVSVEDSAAPATGLTAAFSIEPLVAALTQADVLPAEKRRSQAPSDIMIYGLTTDFGRFVPQFAVSKEDVALLRAFNLVSYKHSYSRVYNDVSDLPDALETAMAVLGIQYTKLTDAVAPEPV